MRRLTVSQQNEGGSSKHDQDVLISRRIHSRPGHDDHQQRPAAAIVLLIASAGKDAEVHDEAVKLDTLPELAANGIVPTEPVPVSNSYQPLERAAEAAEPETSAN